MHYHAEREAYLDGAHRWLMFLVIVFGTSAVVDIFPNLPWIKPLLSAAAAVMGALDLTFDLSGRARNHAVMKRRYSDVLTSCLRNADELAVARSSLMELAGEEEPAYHALIALSHNMAESQVYGDDVEHQFGFQTGADVQTGHHRNQGTDLSRGARVPRCWSSVG